MADDAPGEGNGESSGEKCLYIHNLSMNVTVDDLSKAFNLDSPEKINLCHFTLLTDERDERDFNSAKLVAPEQLLTETRMFNGIEISGRKIRIGESHDDETVASTQGGMQVENNTNIFFELDTTACNNCYEVTGINNAQIVHAVMSQFPVDRSRRLRALKGQNNGKWRLSTKCPNLYEDAQFLTYRNKNIATVKKVMEERIISRQGTVQYVRKKTNTHSPDPTTRNDENDESEVLITLNGADEDRFEHVTDEQLIESIVGMGVGRIKIPIRQQNYRGTDECNGNKYFVLEDLQPGDKDRLADYFDFWDHSGMGRSRMYLSWRGKKRDCRHCRKAHDGECSLMTLARKLEEEREKVRSENHNILPVKTYANSEMRLADQNSLMSNVDCMSGGSTGNIINAMEVDPNPSPVAVVVAGQNEMSKTMAVEEFLWILSKSNERMLNLAKEKKVLIIPPPIENSSLAEPRIKEEFFHENLMKLSEQSDSIQVIDNPIEKYSDDGGQHPSREETELLIRCIDEQTRKFFDTPYLLPSATTESLTSSRIYSKVTGLYKYGCSGCSSKARNKWYNLCFDCMTALQSDENILKMAEEFEKRVDGFIELNNPELVGANMEVDVLQCPHCSEELMNGEQIRLHFSENHPEEQVPRPKRKHVDRNDSRNRRDKVFKGSSL